MCIPEENWREPYDRKVGRITRVDNAHKNAFFTRISLIQIVPANDVRYDNIFNTIPRYTKVTTTMLFIMIFACYREKLSPKNYV